MHEQYWKSPQLVQSLRQPSRSSVFPSSHCSRPVTWPSPQTAGAHGSPAQSVHCADDAHAAALPPPRVQMNWQKLATSEQVVKPDKHAEVHGDPLPQSQVKLGSPLQGTSVVLVDDVELVEVDELAVLELLLDVEDDVEDDVVLDVEVVLAMVLVVTAAHGGKSQSVGQVQGFSPIPGSQFPLPQKQSAGQLVCVSPGSQTPSPQNG
jgi:hypothetical protein